VASKKRTSRKPGKASRPGKPGRQGLSGNPQRRAEQFRERAEHAQRPYYAADWARPITRPEPVPWWPESHANILARVRAAEWPSDLLDVETLAGEIVGDEFHARLNTQETGGLHPSRWLEELADVAVRALRTDVAAGGGDWPRLWAFLCGLHADTLGIAASILAEGGHTPSLGYPGREPAFRPTGDHLVAQDAYGSRFLLVAPFGESKSPMPNDSAPAPTPTHWYAWDLDWCALGLVMAAGPHGSVTEALTKWRDAVGPAAAAAELAPCPPDLAVRLLQPAPALGMVVEMIEGTEPLDLLREYFRLNYRAVALVDYLEDQIPEPTEPEEDDDEVGSAEADDLAESFLAWLSERGPSPDQDQELTAEAVEAILAEWGPLLSPGKDLFYACSPHRIQATGNLIRDEFEASCANAALRLLPDWVQWMLSRRPIDPGAAKRSLEAAHAEAALLVDEDYVADPESEPSPFTRQE
jgi:hypothetical protein